MKKIILPIILLLLIPCGQAITITEVMFDPAGSESDLEYIELYNEQDSPVNISGYILSTPSYEKDGVIPTDTILKKDSYYLIADIGYNANKNETWAESDYEEEMTLINTDGYARLLTPGNETESEISWNASAGGDISVNRDPGNNETYFFTPTPTNSKTKIFSGSISLNVELVDSGIQIINATITDEDEYSQGIQIYPEPAKTRHIPIEIIVEDSAGYSDIQSVEIEFNGDSAAFESYASHTATTKTFSASFDVPYSMETGFYNLTVSATSPGKTESTAIEIQVMALNSFVIDTSEISFKASKGKETIIFGDSDITTNSRPTIKNTGNTGLVLSITSAGLRNSQSTLPNKFLFVSLCDNSCEMKSLEKGYTSQILASGASVPVNIKLAADLAAETGTFTGNINFVSRT